MTDESGNAVGAAAEQNAGWNYKHLACALIIGYLLQSAFLSCLCATGSAKMAMATTFDGLVVLRIIAAKMLQQKDKGWIFYVVLLYSSPLWIELASWITIGRH